MKKIKYSIRKLCTAFAAAICLPMSVALVSCDDFLTVLPTNETILEHYWENERSHKLRFVGMIDGISKII